MPTLHDQRQQNIMVYRNIVDSERLYPRVFYYSCAAVELQSHCYAARPGEGPLLPYTLTVCLSVPVSL